MNLSIKPLNILILLIWVKNAEAEDGFGFLKDFFDSNCGNVTEIEGDLRSLTPWNVGIFTKGPTGGNLTRKGSHTMNFYTSGVIVGPSLVLSIVGRRFGNNPRGGGSRTSRDLYTIYPPENFRIVAGASEASSSIFSRRRKNKDDQIQIREVNYMVPFNDGDAKNMEYHFMLYHLKTPLNFTPVVNSICIPSIFDHFSLSQFDNDFQMAGFIEAKEGRFKYPTLRSTYSKSGSKSECERAFQYHYKQIPSPLSSFCGRVVPSDADDEEYCFLHGSSIYFPFLNGRYFLAGLTALIPGKRHRSNCNSRLYIFGNIYSPLKWIEQNLKCGSSQFACKEKCIPLNSACNGIKDCDAGDDENEIYCNAINHCKSTATGEYSRRIHPCGINGKCTFTTLLCDGQEDCPDGSDESEEICKLIDGRQAIETWNKCNLPELNEGVKSICSNSSDFTEFVPCEVASTIGWSYSRLYCFPHVFTSTTNSASLRLSCQKDGKWKSLDGFETLSCEPTCGLINQDSPPWNAALFRLSTQGSYEYICEATLIEKSVLVTSALCFYSKGRRLDLYNFQIILSPISQIFSESIANPNSFNFNVESISIPNDFNVSSPQNNIALVKINRPSAILKGGNSGRVRPICYMPLSQTREVPRVGQVGKVISYGRNKTFQIQEAPVLPSKECGGVSSFNFQSSRKNSSTFCASYITPPPPPGPNRSESRPDQCREKFGVASGEGGAFIILDRATKKYFLKGVRSQGGRCEKTSALYTHLDSYSDWILESLEKISH